MWLAKLYDPENVCGFLSICMVGAVFSRDSKNSTLEQPDIMDFVHLQ